MCNFLTFWRSLTYQTRQNTHFFNILARQKKLNYDYLHLNDILFGE